MDRCTGRHCRPVLQLPTGQSSSLQTCWYIEQLILAHMEWNGASKMNRTGASKLERVQTDEKGSGNGRQRQAGTQPAEQNHCRQTQPAEQGNCRRTQPADSPSGTGLKTNGHSWPALQQKQQQPQTMSACLSPCSAGKWGECSRAGIQKGGCRPT